MPAGTESAARAADRRGAHDETLRLLDLDELPRWSPWPARLLGLEPFVRPTRDLGKIEEEYDRGKWHQSLVAYRESERTPDPMQLRLMLFGADPGAPRAAVRHGALCVASNEQLLTWHADALANAMAHAIGRSATVVELGCGFGALLWHLAKRFPGRRYVGGEYAESAITLARELYATTPEIAVEKFNFYDPDYAVLEAAEAPVTVFTSQAIEQLPSAAHVLDVIARYRDKIAAVFHLEPAYDLYDDTLLGLMRRRYIEINDYNRDLIRELRRRSDLRIVRIEPDVLGWNPFNALALVHWEFSGPA
ncbi:MAG: methyltransferase domain-containing protein [Dongiaceae bacterium]